METNAKVVLASGGSVIIGILGYMFRGIFGSIMSVLLFWLVIGLFHIFIKQRKEDG